MVINTREFRLNVFCGDNITIWLVSEIELDAGLKTPFEGHLVNGNRPFTASVTLIHGAVKMIGRIKMRAVVRAELHELHRPSFRVGQVLGIESIKK